MPEEKHASVYDLAKLIILIGGTAGVLFGGGKWIYDMTALVATKDYHEKDQAVFEQQQADQDRRQQEQLDNIETAAMVGRINGILKAKCDTGTRNLDVILFQQMSRYKKLAGRDFTAGNCEDGRPVPNVPVTP